MVFHDLPSHLLLLSSTGHYCFLTMYETAFDTPNVLPWSLIDHGIGDLSKRKNVSEKSAAAVLKSMPFYISN